jgi:predicted RNA polymerase sigma factor
VHGDLLEKLGRRAEARTAFLQAAELAGNERERQLLQQRAESLAG